MDDEPAAPHRPVMTATPEAPTSSVRRLIGPFGNVALRAVTIGTKSLLIIALAVWLEPKELGYYGLITAIVSMTNYLLGLDFYTFVVRDISLAEISALRRKLRDQFVLHGVFYGVACLVLWPLAPRLGLSQDFTLLVILVAVLQHATLELYRILLRLQHVLAASLMFFIRDAGWIPLCLLYWWITGAIDLTTILWFWLAGSVASLVFSVWSLWRSTPADAGGPIDWPRLRRGLKTGLRMLPGTLSLRSFFSVDRILLAFLVLPDTLGAYVFYTGLCLSFHGLFESGILPYFWPRLLEAEKQGDPGAVRRARRNLFRVCAVAPLGVAAAAWVTGVVAARLLANPVYGQHLDLLAILALGYALLGGSNGPHYVLFSKGRDGYIVASQLVGLVTFIVASGVLSLADPRRAVPMGLVVAAAVILLLKWSMMRRVEAAERA